jgi:hypothetical protein
MQDLDELPFLVKLLDDEDEIVRRRLAEKFHQFPGDVSRQLQSLNIDLAPAERRHLSELLSPGRLRRIRNEWFVPRQSLDSGECDWETFEFLLRLLSDLLHDGTTVRPDFFDTLDQVAEDARLHGAGAGSRALCDHLFGSGKFGANSDGYYDTNNSDLLWVMLNRKGNPIGLAVLAMLVGHRLGHQIWGCNFPGHFLAWIDSGVDAALVDCYHRGRVIPITELRKNPGQLSDDARRAIKHPCTLRDILLRILTNLQFAFVQNQDHDHIELVGELLQTLADDS